MKTFLSVAVTAVVLTAAQLSGQTSKPLRAVDGHPDLQGTYDIASMTPLERAAGTPLVMTKEEWMVEGGTPNTLLRRGVTRESLKVGTVLVIDGYQARDHSLLRANGRNVTYPDGTKLFLGSSGTGAPTDGADPTEAPKPAGRGRGGR